MTKRRIAANTLAKRLMNMSMKGLTLALSSEATGMYRISLTDW